MRLPAANPVRFTVSGSRTIARARPLHIPEGQTIRQPPLKPRAIGSRRYTQNTITFIFPGGFNGIDFLRRNGEWSERRVVGDIEATIDLDGERLFAGTGG